MTTMRRAGRRPLAIDLYAGAGGLSLGLERAGFDVVCAVESDPIHALVHKYNFPQTTVLRRTLGVADVGKDIEEISRATSVGLEKLGQARGSISDVDAIVGGPPCQGFSAGGVRDSDDARNSQLLRFVEIVATVKPKAFCFENVVGLLEPRFQELRELIHGRLTDAGYRISGFDRAVNASHYGVPQNRRRVIVVGSRTGDAPVLESAGIPEVFVSDALDGLPDIARYRRLLTGDSVTLHPDDVAGMRDAKSKYARELSGLSIDVLDLGYAREHDYSVLTSSLRTVHRPATIRRFSRTNAGTVEPVSRLFRLDSGGLSRTLRAGTGSDRGSHTSPRPIHPTKNRVVTVREAARLHSYPDWFRFHVTNWHGHREVGNSVPPRLATVAGRALVSSLNSTVLREPGTLVERRNAEWLSLDPSAAARVLDEVALN